MQDLRQTEEFSKYLDSIGWVTDDVEQTKIHTKPLLGFGITKIQRPERVPYKNTLDTLFKRRRSVVIYVEPLDEVQRKELLSFGFRYYKEPSLPSKTIQIDLTLSEKKLLSDMHHKTRYNIGLSERKKIVVKKENDIQMFSRKWSTAARERGMFLSQQKEITAIYRAFDGKACILNAYKDSQLLGGVMLLQSQDILYYMYAYSTHLGKKNYAPSLLVWKSLEFGKENNLKMFDFEGIFDDRAPLEKWKGFTRFKKSFGGTEIEFPLPLRKFSFPF